MGNPLEDYYASQSDYLNQLKQQTQPQTGLAGLDPVWLAAAQGFLSPTKTGGFGESIANAAGAVQAPLKAIKDQQLSAADKIRAAQEATAKMYMLQQQRAQDQANNEASQAGQADERAARAEYYRAMAARPSSQDLGLLRLEARDIENEEKKLPQIGSIAEATASPEQREQIKAARQAIADRKAVLAQKMARLRTGQSDTEEDTTTEQPPMPGAKKAPDGKWYVKQGDQWMMVQP